MQLGQEECGEDDRCDVAGVSHGRPNDLEPAGGFERPICRLLYGRSGIELHRLMFKGI